MKSHSIAKNTMFMTIASVLQKVISFVYFAIVARQIGATDTGKYFFALSFTTIFVVFVDMGLTNVLIREGSKIKEKIQDYFSSILFVKLFFGILSYLTVFVVIRLMGYEVETRILVYVSAITMLFDSTNLTLYGTLRAYGNLKYESIGLSVSQALTFILGTVFLFAGKPLIYLMYAFLIPSVLNTIYVSFIVRFKYHLKFRPKYNKEVLKYIIPIVIPLALVAALYPKFSEYFAHDKNKLSFVFHQSIKYLLLVSLPFIVIVLLLSEDIILAFFSGEYLNSVLPLKILMFGVIFAYLNFIFGAILNACDRQKTQTSLIGVIMILNIGLNLLFIPRFGAVGASLSALIGNLALSVVSLYFIGKFNRFDFGFLSKLFWQLFLVVAIMYFVTWLTDLYFGFIVAFVVGSLTYLLMLFITKTITRKQVFEMVKLTSK